MGEAATRQDSGTVAAVAAALLLLLFGGFFWFPGHTYLQSDTQIYLPILDRLADPTLYEKDPVALRPHVAYTIYDEAALLLRRLTGLDFQYVLQFQQLVYRFAGLVGVYLLGRACGLAAPWAVLLASIYGLGATIYGPAVLIAEYEPVPRGYAVALLMLGVGLAAQERWLAAGCAVGWAILYHPPTTVPILVCSAIAIWATVQRRAWRAAIPVTVAIALVYLLSKLQAGHTEPQRFFSTISPGLEQLQQLRGSYNFVSIWFSRWIGHWLFILGVAIVAWWRLRAAVPPYVAALAWGLIAYSVAVVPASYLLLEKWKWGFMPQFQPVRAILFLALLAMLGAALNGIRAANWTSILWFAVAFRLSGSPDWVLIPTLVFLGLGALTFVALRYWRPALAAVLVLPFYLIPNVARVSNYPALDHPEIHEAADWARANTPKDAVFEFADAGQALYPGLFRVYSKRALYVDWKGGGQVNLLEEFADEWWTRWNAVGQQKQADPAALAALGIDYIVVGPKHALAGREPVFRNSKYLVYRLTH